MSANTTKNIRIFGKVQGVYFRAWTQKTATEMMLTGWVRNRKDGSVEALITGPEETVQRFISMCYTGSDKSKVETISVHCGINEGLRDFTVRETI